IVRPALTRHGLLSCTAMKTSRSSPSERTGSSRKKKWKPTSRLTRPACLTRRRVQPVYPTRDESYGGATALHRQTRLAHDQHFPDSIARQEKLDRSEIPEEVFNVPVVEYALQARGLLFGRGTAGWCELHLLHLQHVGVGHVIAIAGRVRARVARVKESQQVSARLHHRPQAVDGRLHQTLFQVIRQIPAQHHVELSVGVHQVLLQKLLAVHNRVSRDVLNTQRRVE